MATETPSCRYAGVARASLPPFREKKKNERTNDSPLFFPLLRRPPQVKVERIQSEKNAASILYLSLRDRSGSVMPVYVGEAESLALEMEISNKRNTTRPIMYDLFKSFVERSGYELSHVIIDDLKSKTYHATCYFKGSQEGGMTIKLDSRPSDALNLAVRFNRPIFVTKAVLELAKDFLIPREKVRFGGGVPAGSRGEVRKGHMSRTSPLSGAEREEIEASVRNLLLHYVDPNMVELQARLQIATMEERFEDAAAVRDHMEARMSQDRVTSVCVAMEAAVDGKRYEEAAVLRNTFLFLMEQKEKEEKKRSKKDKIDA